MEYQEPRPLSSISPHHGPIVYKCSECHDEHPSLDRLEIHLWACHLRAFPFRCSLCNYPSLNAKLMSDHFASCHPETTDSAVEFKRRLDLESRLRALLSQSIHLAVLRCESDGQIYEDEEITDGRRLMVNHLSSSNIEVISDEVFQEAIGEEYNEPEPTSNYIYEEIDCFDYYNMPENEEMIVNFGEDGVIRDILSNRASAVISNSMSDRLTYGADEVRSLEKREKLNPTFVNSEVVDESIVEMTSSKPKAAKRSKSFRSATYYKCEHCDKIIRYPSKIAEHRRSHTGEKPFQCHICKLSFSQRGALKCHIRLHTGEKPFKCTWNCGKSFVSSSARLLHEKAHTGEKPFACQFCNHRFGTKYHLNRHISTRHGSIVNKPTGLEAAGEHAPLIEGLVTAVIEDVRRNKPKLPMPSGRISQLVFTDALTNEENGLNLFDDPLFLPCSVDSPKFEWMSAVASDQYFDDSELVMGFDEHGQPLYFGQTEFDEPLPTTSSGTNDLRQHLDEVIDCVAHNVQDHPGQIESISYFVVQNASSTTIPTAVAEVDVDSTFCKKQQATISKCQYCGVMLKHPSKIKAHLRTHTGERPFVCEICGQRFTQQTPLRNHVKRHVGDTKFECSYGCGKKFVSNSVRNGHELRIHLGVQRQGPPRPYLKPPRRTSSVSEVVAQPPPVIEWQSPIGDISGPLSTTASVRMDDIICAVASGSGTNVDFKTPRRGPLVAECEVCGLFLKHPSKIQAHMRTHTGDRPYKCTYCPMSFSTTNPLKVHIRRIHTCERPFECQWECGRRFVSRSACKEHERVVHEGIKRYQCTIGNCRRLFTRRCYLMKHHASEHVAQQVANPEYQQNAETCGELNAQYADDLFANEEWMGEFTTGDNDEGPPEYHLNDSAYISISQESFYISQDAVSCGASCIHSSLYSHNSDRLQTQSSVEDTEKTHTCSYIRDVSSADTINDEFHVYTHSDGVVHC